MTLQKLDFIFPFFVFFYGILITFVLETKFAQRVAKARNISLSDGVFAQLEAHRGFALISIVVGGLWSLQNLWF
jgi:hypothetical protein